MDNATCAFENPFTTLRFVLLCGASTAAIIGIVFNSILCYLFLKSNLNEPNLAVLALLDCLLCWSYTALFGTEAVAFYMRLEFVYSLYYFYNEYAYILTKVVQLALPAMLILSSMQRWATLYDRKMGAWRVLHSPKGRAFFSVLIVFLAFLSRLPAFWSMEMEYFPLCDDFFRTQALYPSRISEKTWYHNYDLFYTIAQVFVPFVSLVTLQTAIVYKLRITRRRQQTTMRELYNFKGELNHQLSKVIHRERQELEAAAAKEHTAILTTAVILGSYLICNTMHTLLTLIEEAFPYWLQKDDQSWSFLYNLLSDVISFSFMICSVIRLLIYYRFNPTVRRQISRTICFFGRSKRHGNGLTTDPETLYSPVEDECHNSEIEL